MIILAYSVAHLASRLDARVHYVAAYFVAGNQEQVFQNCAIFAATPAGIRFTNGKRQGVRRGAMTGAMRDALELIRSLKKQYPDETEDQLVSRFQKELEADRALKRAIMRDVFNNLLQELDEGKPPD